MAFFSRSRARKPVVSSLLVLGGAFVLSPIARADVYHPVAKGDTLGSVAAKFGVSTDSLRTANGLSSSDSAFLGSMLLRVPNTSAPQQPLSASAAKAAPVQSAPVVRSMGAGSSGSGTLSRAVLEPVREGDTWESIAARFRAAGNDVTVENLRRRNGDAASPVAGANVVVPLGQLSFQSPPVYAPRVATNAPVGKGALGSITPTYSASAQVVSGSQEQEPRALGGGVFASGEFELGNGAPVSTVREIPQKEPIFGSSSVASAPRGNYSSRGGYGDMGRRQSGSEVRVLGQNETANAPRVSTNPGVGVGGDVATTTEPVRPAGSVARVGQVASNGAKIRRLPQSSATTLYQCAVGTRLAVLRQSGAWSAVLMSDRSTGWMPTKYLQMTAQTLDVSSQIVATPGPGGSATYGTRYANRSATVNYALRWLGTPYRYGGTGRRGIDCSALVQNSFAACGVRLPRTAATQARVGMAVAPKDLQAGDRVYFSASGTRIDHTGLYMGNGLFVHASGSGRRVMVSNLFEGRNWNIYVGARR